MKYDNLCKSIRLSGLMHSGPSPMQSTGLGREIYFYVVLFPVGCFRSFFLLLSRSSSYRLNCRRTARKKKKKVSEGFFSISFFSSALLLLLLLPEMTKCSVLFCWWKLPLWQPPRQIKYHLKAWQQKKNPRRMILEVKEFIFVALPFHRPHERTKWVQLKPWTGSYGRLTIARQRKRPFLFFIYRFFSRAHQMKWSTHFIYIIIYVSGISFHLTKEECVKNGLISSGHRSLNIECSFSLETIDLHGDGQLLWPACCKSTPSSLKINVDKH